MSERPVELRATSVTVACPDPGALADFYARLLSAEVSAREADWAQVRTSTLTLNFEVEAQWSPPMWPAKAGVQSATQHLDIHVDDLAAASTWALSCGATLAAVQPQNGVLVLLDPAGHPFCLFTS